MLNTGKLAGKVLYITGASRGIGKAIALKAAQDGAKVVVAAKTAEPHPKLPGTIYTAAEEIEKAGGQALPCIVDIRNEDQIQNSIEETVKKFGGIDILINNASAINLTGTLETPMKKYDLMHQINTRGTYLVSKLALPYLKASKNNPHILNISPPLNMNPRWFRDHCAYTMAKYGMSMCVLGMAEEFRTDRIGVNALWPKTAIITAAMEMLGGGGDVASQCRKVDIMSDAAYVMLTRDAKNYTGNFAIDEAVLREEGVKDFEQYAVVPGADLLPDFFLEEFDDPANIMADLGAKPRFVKGEDTQGKAAEKSAGGKVQQVFDKLGKVVNEDLVKKTQAVYAFKVSGDDGGLWYIDLKNDSGAIGSGEPTKGDADCTFSLTDENFHKMFNGTLKPMNAFMTGALKIQGNMGKAMALDKLMGKMQQQRGYHTGHVRRYSSAPSNYSEVPQIFERIGAVANADIVKKVNASYIFEVEGEDTYLVDLKEGDGSVAKAGPEDKADVKITMNKDNMLKMFNRELKPATAFMTGKLKLSGDLSKAMALEAVMVASREQGFHTSAHRYSSDGNAPNYTAVPQVFDRIQAVASSEIVNKVQAIYCFDVSDEGKYFIDFKNGDGSVGKGDPPTKPDVTITMNTENFLKIFNRELAPATGFMTGKIKVSGDLSKALTLEAVMKASRGE